MSEYNIAFAEKLVDTAKLVSMQGLSEVDTKRTVLYLCLLSMEIALKAMLEKAGMPVEAIKGFSHRLADLLVSLDHCEVQVEIIANIPRYLPAVRLRSLSVNYCNQITTVGQVLEAEREGASKYPIQIRYGNILKHYPPEVVMQVASLVTDFANEYWESFRLRSSAD